MGAVKTRPLESAEWVFVTPELAQEFLSRNTKNRNLRRDLALRYAEDMAHGRWIESPLSQVAFGKSGRLLDGQHTLMAITQAGNFNPDFKGEWITVFRNVPDEVLPVIDIGSIRTMHDILSLEDHPYGGLTGSAAQLALNYLDDERINRNRSKPEKRSFALANTDLFRYAGLAHNVGKAGRPSCLAAVMFLGTRADPDGLIDVAEAFARGVAEGSELGGGDPRLALRNYILGARATSGRSIELARAFAATASAWNAWFENKNDMSNLRVMTTPMGDFAIPAIRGAPERGAGAAAIMSTTMPAKTAAAVAERKAALASRSAGVAA